MMPDGTYRSAREGATLHVHLSSVMFTRQPATGWVIYHEVVETTKSFMRDLTVIEEDWLVELAWVLRMVESGWSADGSPHFYMFRGGGIKKH